jgi:hypothetical protein
VVHAYYETRAVELVPNISSGEQSKGEESALRFGNGEPDIMCLPTFDRMTRQLPSLDGVKPQPVFNEASDVSRPTLCTNTYKLVPRKLNHFSGND